jgi:hypothetical protein
MLSVVKKGKRKREREKKRRGRGLAINRGGIAK